MSEKYNLENSSNHRGAVSFFLTKHLRTLIQLVHLNGARGLYVLIHSAQQDSQQQQQIFRNSVPIASFVEAKQRSKRKVHLWLESNLLTCKMNL